MNGIDAIIALCALTAGFGLLLTSVNEIQRNSQGAIDTTLAKTTALFCAGIIDGVISNCANDFNGEISCNLKENLVTASKNGKIKTASIIGTVKQEFGIQINTPKHYYK